MHSDLRAPERGFTLLEVVCTLVILGVLGSLVFSGFGTALTGYTQLREVGTSDMQTELALIRLQKELAGAAAFPSNAFGDGTSVTFAKQGGTTVEIACKDKVLLFDGQTLLSDVLSCSFVPKDSAGQTVTDGSAPASVGIFLTQQLAERQVSWALSVAPRNTPPAKN